MLCIIFEHLFSFHFNFSVPSQGPPKKLFEKDHQRRQGREMLAVPAAGGSGERQVGTPECGSKSCEGGGFKEVDGSKIVRLRRLFNEVIAWFCC
jgi:hypothetical protein